MIYSGLFCKLLLILYITVFVSYCP